MATDLHERLMAEVTRRLDVARAAADGRPIWIITEIPPYTDPVLLAMEPEADDAFTLGSVDVDLSVREHIALHDPADSIRRYERDLTVLRRHSPTGRTRGWCDHCYDGETGDVPYPCVEVRDVVAEYGLEADGD